MEAEEELFEVECFLDTRKKDAKRYYKVRWKGFPPEEDTWEPEENVVECTEALEAFWKKKKNTASKQRKKRQYYMDDTQEQEASSSVILTPAKDMADLGCTRQATKELYLYRTRDQLKHLDQISSQEGSEATASENSSLNRNSERDFFDVIDVYSSQESEKPDMELIEVNSQKSVELEENQDNSKSCDKIVISLLSDSESDDNKDVLKLPKSTNENSLINSDSNPDYKSITPEHQAPVAIAQVSASTKQHEESTDGSGSLPRDATSIEVSKEESPSKDLSSIPEINNTQSDTSERKSHLSLSLKKTKRKHKYEFLVKDLLTSKEEETGGEKKQDNAVNNVQLINLREKIKELENSKEKSDTEDAPLVDMSSPVMNIREEIESSSPAIKELRNIMQRLAREREIRSIEETHSTVTCSSTEFCDLLVVDDACREESTASANLYENMSGVDSEVTLQPHSEVDVNVPGNDVVLTKTDRGHSEEIATDRLDFTPLNSDNCPSAEEDWIRNQSDNQIENIDTLSHLDMEIATGRASTDESREYKDVSTNTDCLVVEAAKDDDLSTNDQNQSRPIRKELRNKDNTSAISVNAQAVFEPVGKQQDLEMPMVLAAHSTDQSEVIKKDIEIQQSTSKPTGNVSKPTFSPGQKYRLLEKLKMLGAMNKNIVRLPASNQSEMQLVSSDDDKPESPSNKFYCEQDALQEVKNNQAKTKKDTSEDLIKNAKEIEDQSQEKNNTSENTVKQAKTKQDENSNRTNSDILEDTTKEVTYSDTLTNQNGTSTKAGCTCKDTVQHLSTNQDGTSTNAGCTCKDTVQHLYSHQDGTSTKAGSTCKDTVQNLSAHQDGTSTKAGSTCKITVQDLSAHQDGTSTMAVSTCKVTVQDLSVHQNGTSTKAGCTCKVTVQDLSTHQDGTSTMAGITCKDAVQHLYSHQGGTSTYQEKKSVRYKSNIKNNLQPRKNLSKKNLTPSEETCNSMATADEQPVSIDSEIDMKEVTVMHTETGNSRTYPLVITTATTQAKGHKPISTSNNNKTIAEPDKTKQLKKKRTKQPPKLNQKKKKVTRQNTNRENATSVHDSENQPNNHLTSTVTQRRKKDLQKSNFNTKAYGNGILSKQNSRDKNSFNISEKNDNEVSSELVSGDLVGFILHEGNRENHSSNESKAVEDKRESPDSRNQEAMSIDEDDDFDFELEEFPIESLLEEATSEFRDVPSPPVSPIQIPFAAVKQAIREGDEMIVRAALAGELELDTLDGASGMTLLMLASAAGQDGIVELLLRRRADVNAVQKNGMTALMHACEQGCPETAHVLLMCGADINKQPISGETALIKACKLGHTDVVELLLKHGADTKLEMKSGQTAYLLALPSPCEEMQTLLEEHEKRLSKAVEKAIGTCLGDTVSLCKPPIYSCRCIAPHEGQHFTFPFQYTSQHQGKDVVLFCIKANFTDDTVALLFGEDNGVRGVLLNNKSQIPLLYGVRSIFSFEPKRGQNTVTIQTHKSNVLSKLVLCIYSIQAS